MNEHRQRQFALARLLSSAVFSQALLSATSFAVGLMLIRGSTDAQYGTFVLASNAILLAVSLQNALFGPPLSTRLARLGPAERADLVGGLYREQRRLLPMAGGLALLVTLALWALQALDAPGAVLVIAGVGAAMAILRREYFRIVLFAHSRPHDVLRTDIAYAALLLAGVALATRTPTPAVVSVLSMGLAGLASAWLLARAVQRHEPWSRAGATGILRQLAPQVAWSMAGAATHWTFGQGYIFLVAATLDVRAVAAIAATRLLLMPVNLLSTGIGSLMVPLTSGWLHRHEHAVVLRRLCLLACGMAVVTLAYFALIWLARDWIFTVLLKKQFAQRDALLLLWGIVFMVMVLRDQLAYLQAAQGRFRVLTLLTLASAALSLLVSYAAMQRFGVAGALVGMLVGELVNLAGIAVLSFRKSPPLVGAPA